MTKNEIGWLVVCFPDRDGNPDWCEPMSFGRPDEPQSEMLMRRNRFMAFESYKEAEAAVRQTGKMAAEQKLPWLRKFSFKILPIEAAYNTDEETP